MRMIMMLKRVHIGYPYILIIVAVVAAVVGAAWPVGVLGVVLPRPVLVLVPGMMIPIQ